MYHRRINTQIHTTFEVLPFSFWACSLVSCLPLHHLSNKRVPAQRPRLTNPHHVLLRAPRTLLNPFGSFPSSNILSSSSSPIPVTPPPKLPQPQRPDLVPRFLANFMVVVSRTPLSRRLNRFLTLKLNHPPIVILPEAHPLPSLSLSLLRRADPLPFRDLLFSCFCIPFFIFFSLKFIPSGLELSCKTIAERI